MSGDKLQFSLGQHTSHTYFRWADQRQILLDMMTEIVTELPPKQAAYCNLAIDQVIEMFDKHDMRVQDAKTNQTTA